MKLTIADLSNSSSSGYVDIMAHIVKISAPAIVDILFNISFSTGTFPEIWKRSITVPIHKKGIIFDMANYRPISLLPVFSKLLDKLFNQQLSNFLETNYVINDAQHANRHRRSGETALLRLTKLLFNERNTNKWSYLVVIDLSKTFDCINHHLLLNALQSCLLHFNSLKWLASYISHHKQQVKYAGALSDAIPLISGVAKGSNLGPTL